MLPLRKRNLKYFEYGEVVKYLQLLNVTETSECFIWRHSKVVPLQVSENNRKIDICIANDHPVQEKTTLWVHLLKNDNMGSAQPTKWVQNGGTHRHSF